MLLDESYVESTRRRMERRTDRRPDGCWLWTGAVGRGGYGKLYFVDRAQDAHRVAWMVNRGPIPEGLIVGHHCDVRACVNPDHLFLSTQAGNMADMDRKGRRSAGPTHGLLIQAGWTPALRARRAEQTRERLRRQREEAAKAAGVPLDWKYCPRCATWKPRTDYHRNAAREDGLKAYCKPCSIAKDVERQRRKRTA